MGITFRRLKITDAKKVLSAVKEYCEEDLYLVMMYPGAKFTLKKEKDGIRTGQKKISKKEYVRIAAFSDKEFIGTATIERKDGRESHYGEFGITVRKKFRGRGIGVKLARKAEREAKKIGITHLNLFVAKENKGAIRLYKFLGYKKTGHVPEATKFRGRLVDYYLMARKLQ